MTEAIKNQIDFDVRDFGYMLTSLKAHLPVSDYFEACDPQSSNRWWESQREHMIHYFSNRTNLNKPDYSTRNAYELLRSAESIIWLAEALEVLARDELLKLANEALQIPRNIKTKDNSRFGFVLKQVPWELVAERAQNMKDLQGKCEHH